MTVRTAPTFLSTAGIAHPSENIRLALAALVPSSGIVTPTDLAVTANGTPNMTVNVAAGGAWIPGTSSAVQGTYHLYNDATLSVPITTASGSNPRKDIIVARIRDTAEDASGSSDASIVCIAGTPAGTPTAPATPASSILLATVLVGTSVTTITSGNITDNRGATAGDGLVVCTSGTRPTGRTGLVVFETDTANVSIYTGSAWATIATIGTSLTGAWNTYTPTLANFGSWTASVASYQLVGKTLDLNVTLTVASGAGTIGTTATFTLPSGLLAKRRHVLTLSGNAATPGQAGVNGVTTAGSATVLAADGAVINYAASGFLTWSGRIEVQ